AFAALCGVSPIPASSGRTTRHRLNRGGDRQANNALYRIALVRMSSEQRTRDYVANRTEQGKTMPEIIRCLKRYIADEIFMHIVQPQPVPTIDDLRPLRHARGLTLATAAQALQSWPSAISRIERGERRDDALAERYRQWLTAA
ncbi:transposase, partial [Agrococcus pavilionensis]